MSEQDEITVADAYTSNAARTEYLVYTDWNRNAHVVMDIRPASAHTWNRDDHLVPVDPIRAVYEIICSDGVLDRVDGDEVLLSIPQRKGGAA